MKKLYVIDALGFIFRSYFAIRGMTNQEGKSTNALYGFIRSVQKLIKDFDPEHIVVVFDGPNNKASRFAIYEEYKSHRDEMPQDLFPQIEWVYDFCSYFGLPVVTSDGYEADDAMGAIAKWAEKQGAMTFLCSSDKDLLQLVNDNIVILNTHKDNLIIDTKKVVKNYGITPSQFIDYLAIVGDSSDNIPGIAGFGPKTASELLQKEQTLEAILANPECVKGPKKQETLKNSRDVALLSRELATIVTDIDVPTSEAFYTRKEQDEDNLKALYKEMNFTSLLKELGASPKVHKQEPVSYHLVDDEKSLSALIHTLKEAKEVCIDTESSELTPIKAQLVGIAFAIKPQEAYYVPANGNLGLERVIQTLGPLLKTLPCYGHNIKYDMHILKNHGIELTNSIFDTILAAYLLAPSGKHSLDALSLERFGKVKTPIKDLIGTGKKEISMSDVEISKVSHYACEDVDYTCRLKRQLSVELEEQTLSHLFEEIELPLVPVLFKMERNGIFVDPHQFIAMSKELTSKLATLEQTIFALAGEEFNIKSPKQLATILFETLKLKPKSNKQSTAANVLESLKRDHPIIEHVLEFRLLEKLRSTYVDALPNQIYKKTGRIHCNFNQTGTATGRLACQDPNLQNIPVRSKEGKIIREAFIPEKKGYSFLAADYSQIELRLLAHMSEEEHLIKAFNEGQDIHVATAALVYGVPIEKVTKEMRFCAKAVNFGILYGQGAFGLSEQLGISPKEAREFIKTYFETYPRVKEFLGECKEVVRARGYAETISGRKRPIPEINSTNGMIRASAERLAINTPLQGSQADIIKLAMIDIEKKLPQNTQMILQIHDELIFEIEDSQIPHFKEVARKVMEGVMPLKVPLTVDIAVGKNWGEC